MSEAKSTGALSQRHSLKSLDYPHSHVSVMFYARFLTSGYAKHRCELFWITRSRLITLKCCCKLLLRLSRRSWGTQSIIRAHKSWIVLTFMQFPILSAMFAIVWDAISKIETPLFLSQINWINVFSTSQSTKCYFVPMFTFRFQDVVEKKYLRDSLIRTFYCRKKLMLQAIAKNMMTRRGNHKSIHKDGKPLCIRHSGKH